LLSSLLKALARIDSAQYFTTLPYRRGFADVATVTPASLGPVLLDTNVYILSAQRKTPPEVDIILERCDLFHSSVCAAELSIGIGGLVSTHPATPSGPRRFRT